MLLRRYRGHICEEYKIESILNNTDEYIITGSENGKVYFYDLISVLSSHFLSCRPRCITPWSTTISPLAASANTPRIGHFWWPLLTALYLCGTALFV